MAACKPACVDAKPLQSCLTLCDPMDHSPPGSSLHGILQARILEWVAIPYSGDHPTQGLNSLTSNLHWQAASLPLVPPGKPVSGWLLVYYFPHHTIIAAAAKSLQSCPTLCDPIDGSPPGSTAPGILQARTLEWVAISFSIIAAPTANPGNAICLAWA